LVFGDFDGFSGGLVVFTQNGCLHLQDLTIEAPLCLRASCIILRAQPLAVYVVPIQAALFCDAFGGGYTRDDVLRIMHDSRIGTFGAVALVISLGLKWQALASMLPPPGAAHRIPGDAAPSYWAEADWGDYQFDDDDDDDDDDDE
jgi:hypothetical protein